MQLMDYMKLIIIFSLVTSMLTPLYSIELDAVPGTEYETLNGSVAQILEVEGGGETLDTGSDDILKQTSIFRIFYNMLITLLYIYAPLTDMGMPSTFAAIIQAVIWLSYAAFIIQLVSGRYFQSMET